MMARATALALLRSRDGSAAVEMALISPVFFALMFGAYDLGNYFMSEHLVVQAVRDGARYASRRAFSEYTCSTVSSDVTTKTQNLVRTGTFAGTTPRINGWTDNSTVTITVSCDTTGAYQGIYTGVTGGVPVITVSADVPYGSLFKSFGLGSSIHLKAESKVAVMGV
jgi:Flp pilus assembly protein TadG